MSDGRLNKCKTCCIQASISRKALLAATSPEWVEGELARHRAKSARYRQLHTTASGLKQSEWRSRNREKAQAHKKVARAISSGDIIKEPCFCGEEAQAHHDDYSKPLDVVWLCPKHHGERHVELNRIKRLQRLQTKPNAMTHDEEMSAVFTDRRRLDWMQGNLQSLVHDSATRTVDMSGNSVTLTRADGQRFRGYSVRDAVDKAMKAEAKTSKAVPAHA